MHQMEPHLNKFSLNFLFQLNDFRLSASPSINKLSSHYEPIYALMYLTIAGKKIEKWKKVRIKHYICF